MTEKEKQEIRDLGAQIVYQTVHAVIERRRFFSIGYRSYPFVFEIPIVKLTTED